MSLWSGTMMCHLLDSKNTYANPKQVTLAVVIGISDYQSSQIPDLKYADRDAKIFAEWLQSASGGNVPPENIELLINEKATLGRVSNALDYLQDSIKEGEKAIIYFSGHADLETNTFNKFGFLLCWDLSIFNH